MTVEQGAAPTRAAAPGEPPLPGQRARLRWTALGVLLLALSAAPLAWLYLVHTPQEVWQVDLQVYRAGAHALATGFPLYDLRTDQPQFLPFTYPPFAAFTALPLLLASFSVIGWVWTFLQMALLWFTVGLAFRPFLSRFGVRSGLVQGAVAASCAWLMPVSEGVRFGQVNAVIVFLCLWDVTRRRVVPALTAFVGDPDGAAGLNGAAAATGTDVAQGRPVPGRLARIWDGGSGVGVALAAAVKLTPGVFWLHWAYTRRWRTLWISIGTAALVTVASALVLPPASATYWTDALLDPGRLGPNGGTSNQSLRGFLLRVGPHTGALGSATWLLTVVIALAAGLTLSRRFDRLGDPVAVVATVGLVAFLVSPVSWVHHLHWGVVVIGALLGNGRDKRRVAVALVAAALLWMRLPWWGANLLADPSVPRFLARVVQNSFTEWAVLGLLALWWCVARPETAEAARRDQASTQEVSAAGAPRPDLAVSERS